MAESGHRITRPEFPDYRKLFRESDIKSAVAFLIFHFPFQYVGNDSNLLIVFYVQIMPDDFVMQLHRF